MNTSTEFNDLRSLVDFFLELINPILGLLIILALLAFFKGLIIFIGKSGDAKTHQEGKNLMIWGTIALFVMVSALGIIELAYEDFGFSRSFGLPTLPTR